MIVDLGLLAATATVERAASLQLQHYVPGNIGDDVSRFSAQLP